MLKSATVLRDSGQKLIPCITWIFGMSKNRNYSNTRNYNDNDKAHIDRKRTERFWKLTEAKKLKPLDVSVTSSRPLKRRPIDEFAGSTFDNDARKFDRKALREMTNVNMDTELDVEQLTEEYDRHKSEEFHRKIVMRRKKMMRKHFKEYIPQEVSILTWAEKENIRFLHKTDPYEWNAENIAAAYPITVTGVEKLLKSTFRCYSKDDILQHDKKIKQKIELIKNGRIQLTPELREKMKIREKIPFQLGTLPSNSTELAFAEKPKKPFGEFARLVASAEKIREVEAEIAEAYMQESEEDKKLKMDSLFVKEMERLNIRSNERLTLSDFEKKLRGSPKLQVNQSSKYQSPEDSEKTLQGSIPQVQYLLDMKKSKKPIAAEINEESMSQKDGPTAEDFLISYIPKFKPKNSENSDDADIQNPSHSVKIDDGEAYIYDNKTGYQKPFAPVNASTDDRIDIPKEKRVPGATYQVGNNFYDEDGEFLYRVI